MSRIPPGAKRIQTFSGLTHAADAAGYAVAGFEETRIEATLRQRFGRWIYVVIFAPLVIAIGSLVAVGLSV